jgi:hypothetical protein
MNSAQHIGLREASVVAMVFVVASAWPAGGDASTSGPGLAPRLVLSAPALPSALRGSGRVRGALSVRSHSVPQLDPSTLRIDASNFAPATVTEDLVEANADADDKAHDQFAQFHTTSYANLGRISGNIQIADWKPAGGSVVFWYLGSFMTSAAAAQAAQADSVTGHQNLGGTPKPCQNGAPPPANFPNCNYILTQDTGKTTYFADFVWAIGSCLIETDAQFPQSVDSATSTQVITTLDNVTSAAAGLATQLCTGSGSSSTPTATRVPSPTATRTTSRSSPTPTLTAKARATATATPTLTTASTVKMSIEDVRVENGGAKADLSKSPLLVVKAGGAAQLAMYVLVEQGTAGTKLSFTFVAKSGGTRLIKKTIQDSVPASLPAQLHETVAVKPSKQGRYTFTGSVIAQGKKQKRSTTFTVAGSTKKQCVDIGGTKYCS